MEVLFAFLLVVFFVFLSVAADLLKTKNKNKQLVEQNRTFRRLLKLYGIFDTALIDRDDNYGETFRVDEKTVNALLLSDNIGVTLIFDSWFKVNDKYINPLDRFTFSSDYVKQIFCVMMSTYLDLPVTLMNSYMKHGIVRMDTVDPDYLIINLRHSDDLQKDIIRNILTIIGVKPSGGTAFSLVVKVFTDDVVALFNRVVDSPLGVRKDKLFAQDRDLFIDRFILLLDGRI